jgi:hypothetical protein
MFAVIVFSQSWRNYDFLEKAMISLKLPKFLGKKPVTKTADNICYVSFGFWALFSAYNAGITVFEPIS